MPRPTAFLLLILLVSMQQASAQPARVVASTYASSADDAALYYVTRHHATVYTQPDSGRAYLSLGLREPVYVKETNGSWSHIRTQDGAQGYIKTQALSNVWIRVSKLQKTLFLYKGTDLIMKVPADFGYNAIADKERQGNSNNPDHWRTPEGTFSVVKKNPGSKFYRAFVLNYPNAEDADRGLRQGLITRDQHRSIVDAEATFTMPPMGTALGGMIEIHGNGTGSSTNWTQGCIAVHNTHMDALWQWVDVGTPVLVER